MLASDPDDPVSMVAVVFTWTSAATYDAGRPYRLVVTLPAVRLDGTTPNVDGPDLLAGNWDLTVLTNPAGDPIVIDYYTSDPAP